MGYSLMASKGYTARTLIRVWGMDGSCHGLQIVGAECEQHPATVREPEERERIMRAYEPSPSEYANPV